MSMTRIRNATLGDWLDSVKEYLGKFLSEGIRSPAVRRLAEEAVSGKEDYIAAIYDFVKPTFPYLPDPETMELFIHPNRIAEDYYEGRIRQGDCDDHSLLNASMLGSIGYRTRIALIDIDTDYGHAFAEVFSDFLGSWIPVDTTSEYPLGWVYSVEKEVVYPE